MKLKRFKAENFRNISSCDISFADGVNLLYGDNAQGKTNLLDAIYYLSMTKSVHTTTSTNRSKNGRFVNRPYESY